MKIFINIFIIINMKYIQFPNIINNLINPNSNSFQNNRNKKILNSSRTNEKIYINQTTQTKNINLTFDAYNLSFFTIRDNKKYVKIPSLKKNNFDLPKIEEKLKIKKINLKLSNKFKANRENNKKKKFLILMKDISFQNSQIENHIYNEIFLNNKCQNINNNQYYKYIKIPYKNFIFKNCLRKSSSCKLYDMITLFE